jgi:hypothetical protein
MYLSIRSLPWVGIEKTKTFFFVRQNSTLERLEKLPKAKGTLGRVMPFPGFWESIL